MLANIEDLLNRGKEREKKKKFKVVNIEMGIKI